MSEASPSKYIHALTPQPRHQGWPLAILGVFYAVPKQFLLKNQMSF